MTLTMRSDVSATDTEDGLVLLDQRSGRYWHLNRSGAAMLRMLLDGRTPQETAARIAQSSAVTEPAALTDVERLMALLRKAKLVTSR
ncbi:lasso peptide biosynthesis PqqD family chaperone [Actinoplanes sp. NPDC089786]|uniref:lasso peptide biosynthesis PqqD family chaperone n=1 Tax=Actinoplanes sp. NPDC089786 TaxID=3155185 RepID=UPI00342C1270